ncbi:hypothetical protein [Streptomyces sp. NPDC046712]|uniref:hypothetical protein n=1 Tax=Streptomyces sp. NPDC046712 TaxID=3154802 RepID=UPI0033DC49AD
MAEPTNAEILKKLEGLKSELIGTEPKVVTEGFLKQQLPEKFIERFKEMYDELHKEKSSELLEAAGLEGLGAAVEKFHEGNENKGEYLAAAIAGILVPLAIGALILTFQAQALKISRAVQAFIFRRDRIIARNDEGTGFGIQTRDHVTRREAAAGGGTLANPPDPATLEPLKRALGDINRRIINFNKAVAKFPSARSMTKTAGGVQKINDAVTASNPEKIDKVAQGAVKLVEAVKDYDPKKVPDPRKLEKLNAAMASANPTKIKEVATATGKLASAQRHFNPRNLPKAGSLSSAARAAERLANAGADVAQAFNTLKLKAQETAAAL